MTGTAAAGAAHAAEAPAAIGSASHLFVGTPAQVPLLLLDGFRVPKHVSLAPSLACMPMHRLELACQVKPLQRVHASHPGGAALMPASACR